MSIKSDKNILNINFSVNTPNTVWVSDITYIHVNNSFVYLCVVIDIFSRKFISYAVSRKIDSKLVINTFLLAFNKRDKPKNLIFHSDNGFQYTSTAFRRLLDNLDLIQPFSSLAEVKIHIFDYIEGFYNSRPPHSDNNML